jgi:hypothetical protein
MIGSMWTLLTGLILSGQGPDELTGLLEDAGGKPVPGVAVWIATGWTGAGTTPTRMKTVGDAHGRFSIAIPTGLARSTISPEWLSVWAYRPGEGLARAHVSRGSGERSYG